MVSILYLLKIVYHREKKMTKRLQLSVFGASTVHPWQVSAASGVLVLLTVFTPMSILGLNPVKNTDLAPLMMGLGHTALSAAFFNRRVRGIIPGTRATLY